MTTDQELDFLKEYILYYSEVLAHNAKVRLEKKTGISLITNGCRHIITRHSFGYWIGVEHPQIRWSQEAFDIYGIENNRKLADKIGYVSMRGK